MLRIKQFAKLANVTVRTLHHYDRLGLLSPTLRSESGYRLYRMEDLAQLERILVLRYLGISLREIGELLSPAEKDWKQNFAHSLPETLARQTKVLRERRDGINRVLAAIARAERQLKSDTAPDWSLYQSILKEINMQENQDWTSKYYSPEAQQAVEDRKHLWSPELQEKVTADWRQMYADVQSAIERGVAPTSAEGKELAGRWMKLVEAFAGGDPGILSGLNNLYTQRASWPVGNISPEAQRNMPKPELMAFIRTAQQPS